VRHLLLHELYIHSWLTVKDFPKKKGETIMSRVFFRIAPDGGDEKAECWRDGRS